MPNTIPNRERMKMPRQHMPERDALDRALVDFGFPVGPITLPEQVYTAWGLEPEKA